jgi:hypothetical protein
LVHLDQLVLQVLHLQLVQQVQQDRLVAVQLDQQVQQVLVVLKVLLDLLVQLDLVVLQVNKVT